MTGYADDELQFRINVYSETGNITAAAKKIGITRATMQHTLKRASQRGMLLGHKPAMPGYRITQVAGIVDKDGNPTGKKFVQQKPEHGGPFEKPPGHVIKGISTLTDADGNKIVEWIKTKEGVLDPLELGESLKTLFKDYKRAAKPIPAPKAFKSELLTLLPCNDWHLGLYAWHKEVGADWDLKIAEETIGTAVVDTINRTLPSGHCIVLVGGDLLHADNSDNKTAKSGNVLQVDGRYQKVMGVASRMVVKTVETCLFKHAKVTVRILPGNHDEHSSLCVAYFVSAWFRNDPRVTVDLDPSLFWWYRFGRCLLGATHGHTVKANKMAEIMAHRRAKDWGETTFRFIHCFHVHHKERMATEGGGVITEIHQAPIPQDAWHWGSGFLSGRSIKAITYHEQRGWYGDVNTPIEDVEPPKE